MLRLVTLPGTAKDKKKLLCRNQKPASLEAGSHINDHGMIFRVPSACWMVDVLPLHQHPRWVFEQLLNMNQKLNSLASIYNAVVITERHIHHGPNDNLTILYYRSFFDFV